MGIGTGIRNLDTIGLVHRPIGNRCKIRIRHHDGTCDRHGIVAGLVGQVINDGVGPIG